MRSCRRDGVLLRPSTALGAVEASWRQSFHDLVPRRVWAASSAVPLHGGGEATYSYVLGLELRQALRVPVRDLAPAPSPLGWGVLDGWHGALRPAAVQWLPPSGDDAVVTVQPAPAGPHGSRTLRTSFVVVAPVMPGGWLLLEQGKVVSASARRIRSLLTDEHTLRANVSLALNETAVFTVSRRNIAGTWVAFFQERQQYRCGQVINCAPWSVAPWSAQRNHEVRCAAAAGQGQKKLRRTRWDIDVDVALVCSPSQSTVKCECS